MRTIRTAPTLTFEKDITHMSREWTDGEPEYWLFDQGLAGHYPFEDAGSNYEVRDKLHKHGVFASAELEDTEYSSVVVKFMSESSARWFIDALNQYIQKKHELINQAYDY